MYKNIIKYLFLTFLFLTFYCSEESNPTSSEVPDESKISLIFSRLEEYFNTNNRTAVYDLVSTSFKHNGETDFWTMPFFTSFGLQPLELSNIKIIVTGDSATCSFHAKIGPHSGDYPHDDDLGVHILKKDPNISDMYNGWKIYGNQK